MPTPATATATAWPATPSVPAPAEPLDLDQRLVLAALAVDARLDTEPLNLADIIRLPVEPPAPQEPAYPTPVAALLQRAARRLAVGGWCRGATVDTDGARCLYGALRAEDPGGHHLDDALDVLLTALRREFGPGIETIPSANDHLLRSRKHAVRILGDAAALADTR
ncbi:DUF6197 family protein, partial [Streptomyces sp. URMC 125]|uniref:DUF6197 family protein n=1 Tax=Streptomyces sp. URMC 125 TaxID=3423419 RepID=UPI003F19A891